MRLIDCNTSSLEAAVAAIERGTAELDLEAERVAREIILDVRLRGDEAVREYHRRFDGAGLGELEVPRSDWESAAAAMHPADLAALVAAQKSIEAYHRQQPHGSWEVELDGARLGQRVRPIQCVGIHVPAGKVPLPSTLLMAAVPARVAGVPEIVVCAPPLPDGSVHASIRAAAHVAGVDRLFRIGGAQGIAAMAFGTESVPRVDKIVGPGNRYTVAAKRLVFGTVGIESLPGPTEIVVIADEDANASWVAADLLSQAEHGEDSMAIVLTPSVDLARAVDSEVERQLATLPRREVAAACLAQHGWLIVTRDLEEACDLANRIAPEHLELAVADPDAWLDRITNAGAIFLGEYAAEAVGDYIAGPSHVLPTGGTARFSSPLSVEDFLKRTSILSYSEARFRRDAPHVARLARLEGLEGHARAVEIRMEGGLSGRVDERTSG